MINNWHDVSLKQYFDVKAILANNELSDTERTINLLELFSDVADFENKTLKELQGKLPDLSFLAKEPQSINVGKHIKLGEKTYDVATDDTATALQFIDFQTAIKAQNKDTLNFYVNVISSMLCERGKKYTAGGRCDVQLIENMPCELAFSLITFFLPKSVRLLATFHDFLEQQAKMLISTTNLAARLTSIIYTGGI